MKSFLRWAGSKKQLLPELRKYMPPNFSRYVEPFAGSACLFFDISPNVALLGDINADLISTFREVKRNWKGISDILNSYHREKEFYYKLRSKDQRKLEAAERAARFIYLNRYCFNGLYRTNKQGQFNVPYGAERTGELPTYDQLRQASSLLRRAKLISGSFEKTLSMVCPGDFVYIDPPYVRSECRSFTEYTPFGFGLPELRSLRNWLEKLSAKRIPFIATYVDSAEAMLLGSGFKCFRVLTRRSIAGFSKKRSSVLDVIIAP